MCIIVKPQNRLMSLFEHITFLLVVSAFGCNSGAPPAEQNQAFSAETGQVRFRVETVAGGLQVPWGFAWLPTGEMLFTERPGRVRMLVGNKLNDQPVYVVPDVEPSGESGLMDISIHPNFARSPYIYLAYSYNNDGKRVKVVRYTYVGGKFTEPKTII